MAVGGAGVEVSVEVAVGGMGVAVGVLVGGTGVGEDVGAVGGAVVGEGAAASGCVATAVGDDGSDAAVVGKGVMDNIEESGAVVGD